MIKTTYSVSVKIPAYIEDYFNFHDGSFINEVLEIIKDREVGDHNRDGKFIFYVSTYNNEQQAIDVETKLIEFFQKMCDRYLAKFDTLCTDWPEDGVNLFIDTYDYKDPEQQQICHAFLVRRRAVWDLMNALIDEFRPNGKGYDLNSEGFSVDGVITSWDTVRARIVSDIAEVK